jgi:hypothetical protein
VPRFKSTQNIFNDFQEVFDPNWMDSDKIILPPSKEWDYSRELKVEDIDVWEVLIEHGGAFGLYAAWEPLAEFYLLRVGWLLESQGHGYETYYGPGAQKKVIDRLKEFGLELPTYKIWVEPEDMWLYQ